MVTKKNQALSLRFENSFNIYPCIENKCSDEFKTRRKLLKHLFHDHKMSRSIITEKTGLKTGGWINEN